ncbi:MAG: glutamyl-tRNA reductase [Deltaproteobacteria bacterium]|nr:glutamyl-tRNA reductase [Deltaproteobacteria bacterium]
MIRIASLGMSHETAPVALRERLAKDPDNVDTALAFMRDLECIHEGLFISTCNRVEALYTTEDPDEAKKSILSLLSRLGGIPEYRLLPNIFSFEGMEAVSHIFRVASSLDSMVMGEPQILGQIKDAYRQATKAKTSGVVVNRMMHRAFHVAKRVRTETGISDAAVSVSYAAVELAKKIFRDLEGRSILLIGAGEMAELAATHLIGYGVRSIRVANRTFQVALEKAEFFNGIPVSLEEVGPQLLEVDIVITSTASPEPVIKYEQVKGSLRRRRNRPLFFIDIAVPRDVEPRVNELENVYVYDIDDLKGIVEDNLAHRKDEAVKAERIVQEEVLKFERWLKSLEVVPTIISLREKAEEIRRTEMKKSRSALGSLTPAQLKAIETLTVSLSEKIINDPILVLKKLALRTTRDTYVNMARRLFKLDQENGDKG